MMSPLTVLLTEEQMKLKQKQIKEKAPPPGAAKILTRARKEQKKQQQQQPPQPTVNPHPPTTTIKDKVNETNNEVASKNIAKDNPQKSRAKTDESSTIFATNREKESKPNLDSDEEWQNLLEDSPGKHES